MPTRAASRFSLRFIFGSRSRSGDEAKDDWRRRLKSETTNDAPIACSWQGSVWILLARVVVTTQRSPGQDAGDTRSARSQLNWSAGPMSGTQAPGKSEAMDGT